MSLSSCQTVAGRLLSWHKAGLVHSCDPTVHLLFTASPMQGWQRER